jgi:hypothetical protein
MKRTRHVLVFQCFSLYESADFDSKHLRAREVSPMKQVANCGVPKMSVVMSQLSSYADKERERERESDQNCTGTSRPFDTEM